MADAIRTIISASPTQPASMADNGSVSGRTLSQWLAHIESVHFRSIDLTLDRVFAVLQRLLPEGPHYSVISVAGTNGKGSAVKMLTSIYSQTELCVGTYTSPHLVRYTERVRVDGLAVSESELSAAFEEIEKLRSNIPLTYFEFGTLAALKIFQDRGVEIALLEVGMGGRLDAVNAVDPIASLITSVALDHQFWLGADREAIAAEKAGILRGQCPAICAEREPPAAIADHANRIGAQLYQINDHFSYLDQGDHWEWIGPEGRLLDLPLPKMFGRYQLQNAAGVLMVVMALQCVLPVNEEQIRSGLQTASISGRFEYVAGEPLVILDVAHNLAAVHELKLSLDAFPVKGRTLAVCGMLKDKPVAEIAALLEATVEAWYLGTIRDPRGCTADELSETVRAKTHKQVLSHDSVVSAFRAAEKRAAPSDRIVVFGSFHTVGDIIHILKPDSVVH